MPTTRTQFANQKPAARRADHRLKFFFLFAFVFAAALGFFAFKSSSDTNAVNSAYSGFEAGNIITDYVMSDYTSMSEAAIQSFLLSKNPCNDSANHYGVTNKVGYFSESSTFSWHVVNGQYVCMAKESFNGESAAHIIYRAAQDYRINPKVLIVLLQKEQGLVTDTYPNSVQYRSATGYGCPDTAACDSQYYGFRNQVRQAASFFRYILDNGSRYYPVGNNNVKYNPNAACGSSRIYIQNRATSALYQYTPYQPNSAVLNSSPGTTVHCGAYGNSNFYYYFTKWFGNTKTNISTMSFPNDTFTIQVSSGKYLVPASNSAGAKLVISSNAAAANRQYKIVRDGDYSKIVHVASGLVLDLAGAITTNGASIQLYNTNNSCAQKWVIGLSGGTYIFRSACDMSMVFDIPGNAVNTENTVVQLYNSNGSSAQHFTIKDLASAPVANSTYVLETPGAKAIDIDGGRTANGTRVHTYNLTYSNNQQFAITRSDDGFYTVKNVASGKVLDVAAGSIANGAAVQIYDSNGSCAQRWIIEKSNSGYRLLSACSGKALDVPGGRIGNILQKLQIYSANNSNAQTWIFHSLDTLAAGDYKISSSLGKNLVIDVAGGAEKAKNGTNVQIFTANGTAAQKFNITYNKAARAYVIANSSAKRDIDVVSGAASAGNNVQVWDGNSTCAQLWRLRKNSDGTYNIFSTCPGNSVLDVAGGNSRNGANIQMYPFNGTNAQKWTFNKI